MNNVLVTGGAGFIGSNFIHFLLTERSQVNIINLDLLTYSGNPMNLEGLTNTKRYSFVHGDICDVELVNSIFESHKIDTVVHFAAETHVDRSIKNPLKFIQTNVNGTATLLNAAVDYCKKNHSEPLKQFHFHHISTDEVYGSLEKDKPAFSENTPFAPNSPYAASKAASDLLVRAYHKTYHIPITITNCSNNYGPYQFPEKLIPLMIHNAINGKPLPVYGDGNQIRDWLYVNDHCSAILSVIESGHIGETYNIGGNNQPTNLEIIHSICEILDELLPDSAFIPHLKLIQHVADRPGHDRRYAINNDKIQSQLGWRPKENLKSGLFKTIRWYLENPQWLANVINRSEYHEWIESNYKNRGEIK